MRLALGQLLVAFVVFALWRARRLGKPVAEVPPVQIAASELVVAVGNLLQKSGKPEAAAARLRADLHRELVGRLGVSPSASADVVADLASQRTGVDRDKVARTARGPGADDSGGTRRHGTRGRGGPHCDPRIAGMMPAVRGTWR